MDIFKELTDISLHFSKVVGIPILKEDGQKVGSLCDFFVDYEDVYPSVLAIQYKRSGILFYIHWEDVISFSYNKVVIKDETFSRRSRTFPKTLNRKPVTSILANQFIGPTVEYPALGNIVLDKQIVDTHGKKVVRVNDIQLIRAGKNLRVTHAAVGLRSFVRRLGFEVPVDFAIKMIKPKSRYLTNDTLINWKFVHAIPHRNVQQSVRLNLANEDLKEMHPADLADILEDLDSHGRELIFSRLDPELAAETLAEVDEDLQESLLKNETPEKVAEILENMDTDDAADILNEMDEDKADAIIDQMEDQDIKEEIQELLEYDEDSAGGMMATNAFEVSPQTKKSEVLRLISEKHEDFSTIYDIYVVNDERRLVGVCSLQDLVVTVQDLSMKEIMNNDDIKQVLPEAHWKEVAELLNKYNLINAPVVSKEGELLGVVSVDDVLERLLS